MKNGLYLESMINRVFHISCFHTLLQWTAGLNQLHNNIIIRHISLRNKQYHVLVVALITTLLTSCSNDPEQIRQLTESRNLKEDRAKGITAIYSKNGIVKAQLSAALYVKNPSAKMPYTDLNKEIKVDFYGDSGQVVHQLTADSCRFYDNDGNALIWGHVTIKSTKGESLYTEELVWHRNTEHFFTEKPVKIVTGNETLYGQGLEANQDFSWYKITNPTGSVRVQKAEIPQ